MRKEVFAILDSGNPLMTQAIDALKRYHQAQASDEAAEVVERLRLEAEDLFRAISEFQLRMLGNHTDTLQ